MRSTVLGPIPAWTTHSSVTRDQQEPTPTAPDARSRAEASPVRRLAKLAAPDRLVAAPSWLPLPLRPLPPRSRPRDPHFTRKSLSTDHGDGLADFPPVDRLVLARLAQLA